MQKLLILISLFTSTTTFAQFQFKPNGENIRVDAYDSKVQGCELYESFLELKEETLVGINRASKVVVRIELSQKLVKEDVVAVGLTLVNRNNALYEIKVQPKQKTVRTRNNTQRYFYEFLLPKEILASLIQFQKWQAQVVVFSKKGEYLATKRIVFNSSTSEYRVYNFQSQCTYTNTPTLLSEVHINRDPVKSKSIEYSRQFPQNTNERTKEKSIGLVSLDLGQDPKRPIEDCPIEGHDPFGKGTSWYVGATFHSSKTNLKEVYTFNDDQHVFELSPLSAGYLVRQDVMTLTPYRVGTFNKCGRPQVNELQEWQWDTILHPSITLLKMESNNFNNKAEIRNRLNQYPSINTCPQGDKP